MKLPNPKNGVDGLYLWLATFVLPRRLVYWCGVAISAHATTGKYSSQVVPELTALEALKRWDEG